MQLTQLNAKAMLVKLTTRQANLTKRDAVAERFVQDELGDSALIVNKKLFRDKHNPVNKIMSARGEVYTFHRKNTLPHIDKGPRILPNEQYMEYAADMRYRIAAVDNMMAQYMPDYDKWVSMDVAFRVAQDQFKKAKPANYVPPSSADYPSADEFQRAMGFDLRFSPLPDSKHFLFDISDEDVAAFEKSMVDAATLARNDAIGRMLEPLKHLADKLQLPIGAEGATFRDASVENIIEGIEIAKKLMLDESPELKAVTDQLTKQVAHWNNHKDWLRESPIMRKQAADKLGHIAAQMGAFMGAA